MIYIVYGNSISAAHLCIELRKRSWRVEWRVNMKPQNSLRPVRISYDYFSRFSQDIFKWAPERSHFLSQSLQIGGWIFPNRPLNPMVSPYPNSWSELWVDRGELFESLKIVAKNLGVEIKISATFSPPHYLENEIYVMDLSAQETLLWPAPFSRNLPERLSQPLMESLQIVLKSGKLSDHKKMDRHVGQLAVEQGANIFLEPNPMGGYVLSAFSKQKGLVRSFFQTLQSSPHLATKGSGFSENLHRWKALFVMNSGALAIENEIRLGVVGLKAPRCFFMGQSLGTSMFCSNLEELNTLHQAARLLKVLDDSESSDDWELLERLDCWQTKEYRFFKYFVKCGTFFHQQFFQKSWSPYMTSLAPLIPNGVRQRLNLTV